MLMQYKHCLPVELKPAASNKQICISIIIIIIIAAAAAAVS